MTLERYRALDAVRGIAIMGILAMNVISFAMPEAAYLNPLAWGSASQADLLSWSAAFILVDGKMRGLFSLLFGASMLLVYGRAQVGDGNGAEVHKRRMWSLLGLGLLHYYLIWSGDILAMYAACGLVGMMLLVISDRSRLIGAAILFSLSLVIYTGVMAALYTASDGGEALRSLGGAGPAEFAGEVAIYRGSYLGILADRFGRDGAGPLVLTAMYGLETLALMALGIILLRNGFLTGQWETPRYRRFAVQCYAIGLPGSIALVCWCWWSGFDTLIVVGSGLAWSMPFRIATMFGHAAIAMMAWKAFVSSAAMARIEAAGRMAFSNYLGTSLLMTTLFYGYGFGWFGHLTRWQTYLICLPVWALMLLWSKPWLERFDYGPMEFLWRKLAKAPRSVN